MQMKTVKVWKGEGGETVLPLEEVLREIDELPVMNRGEMPRFIGLEDGNKEQIVLTRLERDNWLIETSYLGEFLGKMGEPGLSIEKVRQIVKAFFVGEDWRSLCNLRENYIEVGGKDLMKATIKELVDELVGFVNTACPEFDGGNEDWIELLDIFWLSKGYDVNYGRDDFPFMKEYDENYYKLKYKMRRVEFVARKQLEHEREDAKKERLEREKDELLLSLVKECIEWAKKRGWDSIAPEDIEAFLITRDMEYAILEETKGYLYILSNVEIKSEMPNWRLIDRGDKNEI